MTILVVMVQDVTRNLLRAVHTTRECAHPQLSARTSLDLCGGFYATLRNSQQRQETQNSG